MVKVLVMVKMVGGSDRDGGGDSGDRTVDRTEVRVNPVLCVISFS